MTRLENIALRQRKSFARDMLFAAFIGLAAIIGATSVQTAFNGATTSNVTRR